MKIYKEDNEAIPAIKVQDDATPAPSGYTELPKTITNMDSWWKKLWDYVRITKEVAEDFQAKTGAAEADKWANCSAEEKLVLAKRHVVSKVLRVTVVTEQEDWENFKEHAEESISARGVRVGKATLAIGYQLSTVDRVDLFSEINPMIEPFVKSNNKEINDWMLSQGVWSGGGFSAKSYWSQEIVDTYTTIVIDGE